MEERGNGKRPPAEADSDHLPVQKKPRFPKGKKAKKGDEVLSGDGDGEGLDALVDPRVAAKERIKRRNQMREEELFREMADISSAEVHYEENASFEDDGIKIEPFNLKQEREEGYFDAQGNFVEFATSNDIKDAWLDSAVVDSRFAEKNQERTITDADYQDLSSEEIGKIKRSIANILQPGETIIQALKRLKGTSSDKRGKMSEATKLTFDLLTDDAMKLMESGEYNVYHEEREIFEREAEGYERIARVRSGTSGSTDNGISSTKNGGDIFSDVTLPGANNSSIWDRIPNPSDAKTSIRTSTSEDRDELDMFGEDDDTANENLQTDGGALASNSGYEQISQHASGSLGSLQDLDSGEAASGGLESDFAYDQSSGYYYSSSLGYYYDPASRLYCCATSGKWYSFDEQTGEYIELQSASAADAAES